MFAAPKANHAAICETIARIADEHSRSYRWATRQDREDAVGDAVLHAIAQVGKFDRRRKAKAFSYFTRTVERHFWRTLERNRKARSRHIGLDASM